MSQKIRQDIFNNSSKMFKNEVKIMIIMKIISFILNSIIYKRLDKQLIGIIFFDFKFIIDFLFPICTDYIFKIFFQFSLNKWVYNFVPLFFILSIFSSLFYIFFFFFFWCNIFDISILNNDIYPIIILLSLSIILKVLFIYQNIFLTNHFHDHFNSLSSFVSQIVLSLSIIFFTFSNQQLTPLIYAIFVFIATIFEIYLSYLLIKFCLKYDFHNYLSNKLTFKWSYSLTNPIFYYKLLKLHLLHIYYNIVDLLLLNFNYKSNSNLLYYKRDKFNSEFDKYHHFLPTFSLEFKENIQNLYQEYFQSSNSINIEKLNKDQQILSFLDYLTVHYNKLSSDELILINKTSLIFIISLFKIKQFKISNSKYFYWFKYCPNFIFLHIFLIICLSFNNYQLQIQYNLKSLLQLIISQLDRITISLFHLMNYSEKGVYQILINLISIVYRLILLPLGKFSHFFFKKYLNLFSTDDSYLNLLLHKFLKLGIAIGLDLFVLFNANYDLILNVYNLNSQNNSLIIKYFSILILFNTIYLLQHSFVECLYNYFDIIFYNILHILFIFMYLLVNKLFFKFYGPILFIFCETIFLLFLIILDTYHLYKNKNHIIIKLSHLIPKIPCILIFIITYIFLHFTKDYSMIFRTILNIILQLFIALSYYCFDYEFISFFFTLNS